MNNDFHVIAPCRSVCRVSFGDVGEWRNVGCEEATVAVARDARPYRGGVVGAKRRSRGDRPTGGGIGAMRRSRGDRHAEGGITAELKKAGLERTDGTNNKAAMAHGDYFWRSSLDAVYDAIVADHSSSSLRISSPSASIWRLSSECLTYSLRSSSASAARTSAISSCASTVWDVAFAFGMAGVPWLQASSVHDYVHVVKGVGQADGGCAPEPLGAFDALYKMISKENENA